MPRKFTPLSVTVFFAVVGLLIYSNVIANGAFVYDDFDYVVGNPIIQDFSHFLSMTSLRYMGYLSFAVNYAVGGENPFGFHLFNVIIHIVNATLVFLLVQLLLRVLCRDDDSLRERNLAIAALTGLLFLVHPMGTQAVSYISQRFTSLSAMFYLLAVYWYLLARAGLEREEGGARNILLMGLSLLATVLAMKTKEIAFTVPLMMAVLEALIFRGSGLGRRRFLYLVPFMAMLVIIPLSLFGADLGLFAPAEGIEESSRVNKQYDLLRRSPTDYLFTQFRVIVIYLRMLLFPAGQRVVYDVGLSHSLLEARVLASLLLLLLIAGVAVYAWRRGGRSREPEASEDRLAAIGVIWFFTALSVESSIIPIKDLIFEHRAYLPSVGFYAACAVLLMRGAGRVRKGWSVSTRASAIALLIGIPLAAATFVRNDVWTSEIRFWDDVAKKSPNRPIGYNNRGTAYFKARMYELALQDLNRSISFFPEDFNNYRPLREDTDLVPGNMAKTYTTRGETYLALGQSERAQADFNRARELERMGGAVPELNEPLKTADFLAEQGDFPRALEEYGKILSWDPANINALVNRANVHVRMNRFDEALRDLNNAVSLRPDFAEAYHNRGVTLASMGELRKAAEDFRKACGMGFRQSCELAERALREAGGKKRD